MRKIALFSVVSATAALCLSAACSGETNTITNTVYVTVTGGNGGAGGDTGGAAGTGGTAGTKAVGEHCKAADECAGGLCFDEESTGLGLGYCSTFCNAQVECPSGETCVDGGTTLGTICLIPCDPAGSGSECQSAQSCLDMGDGTGVCWAGCTAASDCPILGSCDAVPSGSGFCMCTDNTGCPTLGNCEPGGYCTVPELCSNTTDDDADGLADCEDGQDCGADATCSAAISGACTGAVDVSAGGSFDGNTAGGTNTFAQSCSSIFGNYVVGSGMNERVYMYTAASAVSLGMKVTTASGSVDWYVRTACDDPGTGLGCLTEMQASDAPVTWEMAAGDTVYIFVDAYGADAAFTLEITTVDLGALCTAATVIAAVGDTNGTNIGGSQVFSGSCGGSGTEAIYMFTPAQNGNLVITQTPTGGTPTLDGVLYARTTCGDGATELGCSDSLDPPYVGGPESITVAVTTGTPIYIFSDAYGADAGPFTLTLAYQ
jgi:hypothetical protein